MGGVYRLTQPLTEKEILHEKHVLTYFKCSKLQSSVGVVSGCDVTVDIDGEELHVVVTTLREKRLGEFEQRECFRFDALHIHSDLVAGKQ